VYTTTTLPAPHSIPRRFYKRRTDVVFAIYKAVVQSMEPLVLKFSIHPGQAGRKGVRRGEEEGVSRGVESQYS
jgi:hypothetical protein